MTGSHGWDAPLSDAVFAAVLDALDPLSLAEPVRGIDGRIVDFRIVFVNPSGAALVGLSPEEFAGHCVSEIAEPGRAAVLIARLAEAVETGVAFTEDLAWARSGDTRSLEVRFERLGDLVLARGFDTSDRIAARRAVAESEERYRNLAETAGDFVMEMGAGGVITWASSSITAGFGWEPADLVGRRIAELTHPHDLADRSTFRSEVAATGRASHVHRMATKAGDWRWVKVTVRPLRDDDQRSLSAVATGVDIQAEIDARSALAASEERFRLIAELASDIVMRFGDDAVIQWVSPSVTTVLGWAPEQVVGRSIAELVHPDETSRIAYVDERTARGEPSAFEGRLRSADGTYRWFDVSVRPVRDAAGALTGHVSGLHDITAAVEARAALAYQATHDPLTHVANRTDLYAHIDEMLGRQPRTGDRVGVLFVDVDHLKAINDTYGHAVGDGVLVAVASRIRDLVRADDVVARFGGDEFVVVLQALHSIEDAEMIAGKILAAMAAPVDTEDHVVPATVSIGIALADPGTDPDATLQQADRALYRAKAAGRSTSARADVT